MGIIEVIVTFTCIWFSNRFSLCKSEQNGQIHSLVICVDVGRFSMHESWYLFEQSFCHHSPKEAKQNFTQKKDHVAMKKIDISFE
jgi:hypothetical protein